MHSSNAGTETCQLPFVDTQLPSVDILHADVRCRPIKHSKGLPRRTVGRASTRWRCNRGRSGALFVDDGCVRAPDSD
jgi:hypothetical protein